jgi:hypothetical protein
MGFGTPAGAGFGADHGDLVLRLMLSQEEIRQLEREKAEARRRSERIPWPAIAVVSAILAGGFMLWWMFS